MVLPSDMVYHGNEDVCHACSSPVESAILDSQPLLLALGVTTAQSPMLLPVMRVVAMGTCLDT